MIKELPEIGEVVVVQISKILDYGVFVDLLEFERVSGFVHISQVASSWIKNIRNHVSENQIRVAEVTRIDTEKNQIDLSFTKVSPGTQKEKIEEFRQTKRINKLLELLAEEKKKTFEDVWKEVVEPLQENYDYLYQAFEAIAIDGEKACLGVPKAWIPSLVKMVQKNVSVPHKTVKAVIEIHSTAPEGAELVKAALISAQKLGKNIEMIYEGSGKFLVKSTESDFKKAEKKLREVCEKAVEEIKSKKGFGEFKVMSKKGELQAAD
ncbi:MAG: S1 RNA-binding domain-containing protein [Candidatus Diapherotrites archaeon]|nr:S1 RNA-binding domain-containing protein [Candidatus Diapherotrites archaeon]